MTLDEAVRQVKYELRDTKSLLKEGLTTKRHVRYVETRLTRLEKLQERVALVVSTTMQELKDYDPWYQ